MFISEQGKSTYYNAYDSLLKKYHVEYEDIWINTYLGKAHLIETGKKDGPPVLMLHAAGLSAAEWFANYNALGVKYHLYGLDMPGDAGKSTLSKNPKNIKDYQQTILQILDFLGIEKVILVGHSIGGFFATGFVLAHPDRVQKFNPFVPGNYPCSDAGYKTSTINQLYMYKGGNMWTTLLE